MTKRTVYCAIRLLIVCCTLKEYSCTDFEPCNSRITTLNRKFNTENSPLLIEYTKETVHTFYPLVFDNVCYLSNETVLHKYFRLTCPGSQLKIGNNKLNSSLILARYHPKLTILTNQDQIIKFGNYEDLDVECTDMLNPKMRAEGKYYQVGFQLNLIDFLTVYDIFYESDKLRWAHVKVLSIIESRSRLDKNPEYRKGVRKMFNYNFTDVFTKDYQIKHFGNLIENKTVVDQYFLTGKNYFVPSQLISKEDLFYINQQKSTFFYENAIPVWQSIAEGNWNLVGDIIRNLASEFMIDFDLYSGTIGTLNLDHKQPIYLGNGNSQYSMINIPKILFKLAVSVSPHGLTPFLSSRGIVFLTVNDPLFSKQDENRIDNNYVICNKLEICAELYPQFSDAKKGYTYCCDIRDFPHWNTLKGGINSLS